MNFKLKFQTSATTALEPYEIVAMTQLELKDKKYKVIDVTGKSVIFKDNPWRLRWNFEPLMLDEGKFVINDHPDGGRELTLIYHWKYYPFALTYAFMVI